MIGLLGEIIPIGLLLALGPTRIISTILLLTSAQPIRNAASFLLGVAAIYLIVGLLTLLVFGRMLSDIIAGTFILDAALVVAGLALLVVATKSFFREPSPDALPSGWMRRLTSISAAQAFLFGVVLAFSLNKLLIFISAVVLIYESRVSLVEWVIALLVLIALTLLCQLIPLVLYATNKRRARRQIAAFMDWLNQHNRVIMISFSLVLGVIFLVAGLTGLLPIVHTMLVPAG
jgi:hypothetical protein